MKWSRIALLLLALAVVGGALWYTSGERLKGSPAEPPPAAPANLARVDEISRHPNTMPKTADYALYKDGRYQQPVKRDGPVTHEIHFTIKEVVAEIVDGTTGEFWTFDGKIPGPMVRARVGDTLDFYLHNEKENRIPHNVDFHAVTGPGGGSVSLDTAPGATSRLKVKLINPGIYIYHCAWPDIPTHIAHGMYGLIVVEPQDGLEAVDHEYYLMQSEFFTEAGGTKAYQNLFDKGHLNFSGKHGNLEEPTFVVFNGRPEAVAGDRAIGVFGGEKIRTGETVRLFVGNIGPGLISSFHVIGEIFDKVYMQGSFSTTAENVQTTLIPAGGATGVEISFEVPGTFTPVDHSIFRVHKGAAAVIKVGGPPNPDIYDPIKQSDLR